MTSDFFIRLTMAVYKVVNILPKQNPLGAQIQDSANKLLASLILLAEENPISKEQKNATASRAIQELGMLVAYLNYAKRTSDLNPGNFLVLEREYTRVGEFLRQLHQNITEQTPVVAVEKSKPVALKRDLGTSISTRQTRILELMRNKPKTQVWELQKVLPEVTKRTLRRDLDDLLSRKFIIRQGEWNEVFYQIR